PPWLDQVLAKALAPSPGKRQEEVAEFAYDLKAPGPRFQPVGRPPLIERDPVLFWKCLSALLALSVVVLLFLRSRGG
ncbi:MAG TPA: bifunctional protein-serine/threonine kinase/phosphatase, partial [Azospira sp.]|nr:bifunctional protein-serine/threonine kinase/phosphatase [Azospira sp.]